MKKNIRYLIIFVIIICLIIGFIYFRNINNNKISETKVVHDIKFSNALIKKKKGNYLFKVTLTSSKTVEAESVDITIKDRKGKTLDILSGYIGNISKGETKIIETSTKKNLRKAYEVIYTIYKD